MTAAIPELLPCPFCGGAAEWNTGLYGDGTPWRYIACEECEAMGPHVDAGDFSATDAWNRRHQPPTGE